MVQHYALSSYVLTCALLSKTPRRSELNTPCLRVGKSQARSRFEGESGESGQPHVTSGAVRDVMCPEVNAVVERREHSSGGTTCITLLV